MWIVSHSPQMIGIDVGRKSGVRKDTGADIHARGESVVNIGDASHIEAIHLSSVEHAPDVGEADLLGLQTEPSVSIGTPRPRDVPISMACRLERAIEFGRSGSEFLGGEVPRFHVRDDLYDARRIDTRRLQPVCRIAGLNRPTAHRILRVPVAEGAAERDAKTRR